MCGKFTAMASWADVVAFSQSLTADREDGNDRPVTLRVMSVLPVIVWDQAAQTRRVVPMRWGFPNPRNANQPDPIHVRSETIAEKPGFREAFHAGQRGIVLARTFNEGLELPGGKTEQHTITPGEAGAVGIALLWRSFALPGGTLTACVMATVPANRLIGSITDRMPAILAEEDWAAWLGESPATPAEVKACLKTVEGVRWSMTKEERKTKAPRGKPTVRNPGGLF